MSAVTSMVSPIPTTWTTGSTESIKTGTWRAALPRHIQAPAPCHGACPVSGDIAEWIGLVRAGDFYAAWQVLVRHNPFPAIAGRICHHPCEAACNRGSFDQAMSICKLERFVGDQALAQAWAFDANVPTQMGRVAVLGAGPSGLSAAYQLRRLGYRVALYENRAELGGLMRYGIPAYRLSRDVLDGEIARILALGIEVHCNSPMNAPQAIAQLRQQYDAVYLATGAPRQKRLPNLDYSKPWVYDGSAYLLAANSGQPLALGKRLLVIGGGSAALDAARSARRAGHQVSILALEQRSQMPAQAEEVHEALEEGIELIDGARLDRVSAESRTGVQLACSKVLFTAGSKQGQFTLTPVEGGAFTLSVDAIITSIGQDPDLAGWADNFAKNAALLQVDQRLATSQNGVYAGGDLTSMARFVTEAVAMGERAARAIHEQLKPRASSPQPVAEIASQTTVALRAINTFYYPKQARAQASMRAPEERLKRGLEVQLGLDLAQVLAESERCFSCGTCIHCDNCVVYCPDLAVQRTADGYQVLGDYCKGCGVCVAECPTGSMLMQEERR